MNPLRSAELDLQKARARLDDLAADQARFKVALEDSEATERKLRKDRAEIPALTEARTRSAAARELLAEVGAEVTEARAILPTLERNLARERIMAEMEASAREGTKHEAALRAELRGLAELIGPILGRITEAHSALEGSRAAYDESGKRLVPGYNGDTGRWNWADGSPDRRELEAEIEARGVSTKAVAEPLKTPEDLSGRIAWTILREHLATERRNAEQIAQREAAAARNRRAKQEERAAMVAEFFVPARYAMDVQRAFEAGSVFPIGSRRVETRELGQTKPLELLQIGVRQTQREAARSALAATLPPEVEVRIVDAPGAYAD